MTKQIPLGGKVRECGDSGTPIVLNSPDSDQAKIFMLLAKKIASEMLNRSLETGTHSGSPEVLITGFDKS